MEQYRSPQTSIQISPHPKFMGVRTHSPSGQKWPRDDAQRHRSCAAATGSSAPALPEQEDAGCDTEKGKRRMESLSSSRTSPPPPQLCSRARHRRTVRGARRLRTQHEERSVVKFLPRSPLPTYTQRRRKPPTSLKHRCT